MVLLSDEDKLLYIKYKVDYYVKKIHDSFNVRITNEEIDFPVTSSIYAKFYEDGTFILSSSNYIDESKGNYKDYGDIAADKYGEDNLPEWLNDPIIEVLVYDKIQPVNTSNWFRRTERKDRHNKNNRFKKFRYK